METFKFRPKRDQKLPTFNGPQFFNVYKDADFLRIDANVESLLCRGYELRQKLSSVPPGDTVVIEGMKLERNTPLLIKKTGTDIIVEEFEFTFNRLVGLAAGFALENRRRFPNIKISDANALGLEWDNENEDKCKLYLSTLSGTEYLTHLFSFYPLLCGLRKFQLNKMPIKLVEKIGNIKNKEGMTMAAVLKANMVTAKRIWLMFPSVSLRELQTLIEDTPQLAKLFSR